MKFLSAILLAIVLALSPTETRGGFFGQSSRTFVKEGGSFSCSGPFSDFLGSDFDTSQSGAGCAISLAATITKGGSCIGDILADLCDPFDTTGITFIATTVFGGDASGENLLLQSTSHSTRGYVGSVDQLRVITSAPTLSSATDLTAMELFPAGLTVSAAGYVQGQIVDSTFTYTANPNAISSAAFYVFAPTITNSGNRTLSGFTTFYSQHTFSPAASTTLTGITSTAAWNNVVFVNGGTSNTATAAYGLQNSGQFSTNWTISDWAAVKMNNPAGSGGTATRVGAMEIADLTRGTTNYSIWSRGAGVFMAHEGNAWFGNDQASLSADPGVPVRVTQQTIGSEVFRAESVPGAGDRPNFRVFQQRSTTSGTTPSTVTIIATASNQDYMLDVHTQAICTSGAGCTAGQMGGWARWAIYKNVAGALSEINETSEYAADDITGTIIEPLLSPSGTNIQITYTGLANQNITWQTTVIAHSLGS